MKGPYDHIVEGLKQGPCKLDELAMRVNMTNTVLGRALFAMNAKGMLLVTGPRKNYIYALNPDYLPPDAPRERPASSIWDYAQRGML